MKPLLAAFLFFGGILTTAAVDRLPDDGTRLSNGMVTPIYIDFVEFIDEDGSVRIRLRDEALTHEDLYAVRETKLSDKGQTYKVLQVTLQQPVGKRGAVEVAPGSDEEYFQLHLLRLGLQHYYPGWTGKWSTEKHEALLQLEKDLSARQKAAMER